MKRWIVWSFVSVFTFVIGGVIAIGIDLVQLPGATISPPDEPLVSMADLDPTTEPPTVEHCDLSESEQIEDVNGRAGLRETFKIKLLRTGEGFHGDDVSAKTGEKWLGFFNDDGKFFLREVPLKISRVRDEVVDSPESKLKTGKSVSVPGTRKPIFLLKNANLPHREVRTFFLGKTWDDVYLPENEYTRPEQVLTSLQESFSQVYDTGTQKYEIKVIRARNLKDEEILALILRKGHVRQVLHTMEVDANPDIGSLYWAGDLDQDNKPDFYLDLFEHYNVRNQVLFLSSRAESGKLVKKVAYFWTTGC